MKDLIARLEKASSGGPDLDFEIESLVFGAAPISRFDWPAPPRFTTSLDAALTLVPEGWSWSVVYWKANGDYHATVADGHFAYAAADGRVHTYGESPTPAIALCIAALKARSAA